MEDWPEDHQKSISIFIDVMIEGQKSTIKQSKSWCGWTQEQEDKEYAVLEWLENLKRTRSPGGCIF